MVANVLICLAVPLRTALRNPRRTTSYTSSDLLNENTPGLEEQNTQIYSGCCEP
jgi:hypothetical protein